MYFSTPSSTVCNNKNKIQPDVIDFVPENETYWQMAHPLLIYSPKYLLGWIVKVRTIWFSSGTGTTYISTMQCKIPSDDIPTRSVTSIGAQ